MRDESPLAFRLGFSDPEGGQGATFHSGGVGDEYVPTVEGGFETGARWQPWLGCAMVLPVQTLDVKCLTKM